MLEPPPTDPRPQSITVLPRGTSLKMFCFRLCLIASALVAGIEASLIHHYDSEYQPLKTSNVVSAINPPITAAPLDYHRALRRDDRPDGKTCGFYNSEPAKGA